MSERLAMTLPLTMFFAIAGQSIAQERDPGRANRPPSGGETAREPVIARDVIVWELRVEGASCSLNGFLDGPRCTPPRPGRDWIVTHAVDTYIAKSDDPTPQGYSEYGVCGLGGIHIVQVLRAGNRVFRLMFSKPMDRP